MEASELFGEGPTTPMGSDLLAGLQQISLNQKVKFRLYGRVVLPIDGYVFWVRGSLVKQPIFQQSGIVTANQLADDDMEPGELVAKCSLHYTTDFRQEETENYAANRVVFTTNEEVQEFNEVAPGTMWIGEYKGLRFGFSSSSGRYHQANLWHYAGFALYPDMEPQIVDDVQQFSSAQVVSNSLPAWLALQSYQPAWAFWGPMPPMFPSFLIPDNEPPPFISVHINPEGTRGLASAPTIDPETSSHTQLCADTVRITLWGTRNFNALGFVDALYQYSADTGVIGLMNIPVLRDEKRTQAEMRVIAMKKSMDVEVSYLQNTMRSIGKKQIKSALASLYVPGIEPILPPFNAP